MTLFTTPRTRYHGGRRRLSLPRSWLPLLLAGTAACHSSTGPTAATTGTLIVTLPQPPGTTASAVVAGPGDFAVFVPPDTLTLLSVGTVHAVERHGDSKRPHRHALLHWDRR